MAVPLLLRPRCERFERQKTLELCLAGLQRYHQQQAKHDAWLAARPPLPVVEGWIEHIAGRIKRALGSLHVAYLAGVIERLCDQPTQLPSETVVHFAHPICWTQLTQAREREIGFFESWALRSDVVRFEIGHYLLRFPDDVTYAQLEAALAVIGERIACESPAQGSRWRPLEAALVGVIDQSPQQPSFHAGAAALAQQLIADELEPIGEH